MQILTDPFRSRCYTRLIFLDKTTSLSMYTRFTRLKKQAHSCGSLGHSPQQLNNAWTPTNVLVTSFHGKPENERATATTARCHKVDDIQASFDARDTESAGLSRFVPEYFRTVCILA
eukprot:6207373-Pleurochrysis_carterae.AAC.1